MTTPITTQKCTIYVSGGLGFGIAKYEAKTAQVEVKPYAQYPEAVHVRFRPPRMRKDRGFVESSKPWVLILEGWGHPDAPNPFSEVRASDGVITRSSRFMSCSPMYRVEFNALIDDYLAQGKAEVVFDRRERPAPIEVEEEERAAVEAEERKFVAAAAARKVEQARMTKHAQEHHYTGEKYETTKDLGDAEVTRLVRQDLKAQFPLKAGYKFRVRKVRSGWTYSINVSIEACPVRVVNPEHVLDRVGPRYSEEGQDLINAVYRVLRAYNFDKGDPMSDYWCQRFFTDVSFSHDLEQAQKAELAPAL